MDVYVRRSSSGPTAWSQERDAESGRVHVFKYETVCGEVFSSDFSHSICERRELKDFFPHHRHLQHDRKHPPRIDYRRFARIQARKPILWEFWDAT